MKIEIKVYILLIIWSLLMCAIWINISQYDLGVAEGRLIELEKKTEVYQQVLNYHLPAVGNTPDTLYDVTEYMQGE